MELVDGTGYISADEDGLSISGSGEDVSPATEKSPRGDRLVKTRSSGVSTGGSLPRLYTGLSGTGSFRFIEGTGSPWNCTVCVTKDEVGLPPLQEKESRKVRN